LINVVIIAPVFAVRAGLRAMLAAGSDETKAASAVSAPLASAISVIWEAAALSEPGAIPPETDVLVMTADVFQKEPLSQALVRREGHLALLLLTDRLQAVPGLAGMPWRAWGVLPVDASVEELGAAVQAVHEGLIVGTPDLIRPFYPHYLADEMEAADPLIESLTERETQVLQLLAQGLANKQIAAALGISDHTVKFHVASIYSKLGATNRTEAVRMGIQRGLVVL
jgi:NarL family two-component system response regulator YdfI